MSEREPVRETQELLCKLNAEEMKARSQKLVHEEQALRKQESEKKAKVAELNALLKQTKAEIDEHVKVLSSGEEKRPVQVEKRWDFAENVVRWVRLDTLAVVQTLPMDAYDRQEALELDGANNDLPPPEKAAPRRRRKRGELNDVPDQGEGAEAN